MRILHVSQPTTAGVALVVRQAVEYQSRLGHELVVACPAGGDLATDVVSRGHRWVAWEAARQPGLSVVSESVRLRAVLREQRPDIVHLHASKAGLIGRLVAPRELHVIFQPHSWSFEATEGVTGRLSRMWERWAQRRTDATLWCSWGEQTVGLLAGVRAAGVVAMNGVDLLRFRPPTAEMRVAARRALDLPSGVPVAVVVGRLTAQKGQDLLIRAWPQVRQGSPDARLILLGDGPDSDKLHQLAGDGVFLMGGGVSVASAYQAADVAVLPSRWEGMSLAMLEGMASGLSTVATDVSGAREALTSGTGAAAGQVVPTENVRALATAVLERLRDGDLRAEEGRAARDRAEKQFASDSAMEVMVSTYALISRIRLPRQQRRRITLPDAVRPVPPPRPRSPADARTGRSVTAATCSDEVTECR